MTHMAINAMDQKRQESQLSADFIMHDPSLPQGISDGLEYDRQRATFEINSRSRDAVQFARRALELYYDSSSANQSAAVSSNVTWDDVFETAKQARREDQKETIPDSIAHKLKQARADYSSKGRLHKFGRSLGDIAPAVVHKLDFAPDEMYIGVICQGLKLVFDVAIQVAKERKKILQAFENIPELVKDVQAYDKYFSEDRDYVVFRGDFDICLLTSITKSIQWLAKPSIWKSIDALIKGPLATQSVDDLMDDVQVKRARLQSQIQLLNVRRQFWSSKDTETAVQQGSSLRSSQAKINDQVAGTAHDVKNMVHDIKDMAQKMQDMHAMIQQQERYLVKAREDTLRKEICNRWMALLDDSHKKRKQPPMPLQQQQQQHQAIRNVEPDVLGPFIYQDELTSFMAVDNNHLSDISRILENSARFDMEEMRLAYAIANSTDTKTWLNTARGILFLNGSGGTTAARESPISASLASLAFGITENPDAIVLHFFCGLHSESYQAVSGPTGLMRSLIAQLSLKHDFKLDFVCNEVYREGVRDHDMQTLCETFSAMICQLPANYELYCIIDGISWLETPRWRYDFTATVAYICYLIVDPHCQASFKLLMSSPMRSFVLAQELRQYGGFVNIIELHSVRLTERDMPTERELAGMARR